MAKAKVFAIVITLSASLFFYFISITAIVTPVFAAEPTQVLQLRQTKICQSCDLARAYLVANNLAYAYLLSADLSNASLSFANLDHASLSRSDLSGAILERAILTNAKLLFSNLSGANLTAADLSGANLNSADLNGANLTNANLDRADLSYARNMTIAQVKAAQNWQRATYSRKFRNQLMTSKASMPSIPSNP
jgi:uncharacterized protein YjbI with pentapeptide repeats